MNVNTKLDQLLSRWEALKQRYASVSAEELCADCPDLRDEFLRHVQALEALDPLLQQVMGAQNTTPMGPSPVDDSPLPGTARSQARYRVIRFHAKGGLGEVFLARDEELQREVALKRMQRPMDQDPTSRQRFLREAAITSRLEHPGVVPLHGIGQDDQGQPCYIMRFIAGETLHEAIHRFHAAHANGAHAGEQNQTLRQLLNRFVSVCNTIAYAHSRGVIHRDLKPANIVLGSYGETLVLDWGIAKCLETKEPDPLKGAALPPSSDLEMPTQQGSALGTPAYMSPEQAAGQWDQVGPASDVFGLGATLYALLTGQAPLQGKDGLAVLANAREGRIRPPRSIQPRLSPALEAICLKAMAFRPEDRYATALELAGEVEDWLAGEPVEAWPEPWPVRGRRWLARHRTLVTSTSAVVLVAALILAVATAFLKVARDGEQEAKVQAQRERDDAQRLKILADTNAQRARQAVHQYFTAVSQSKELAAQGLEPLRRQLLLTAKTAYEEFIREDSQDPTLQEEQGANLLRLATLSRALDQGEAALEQYRQAMAVFDRLARDHPDNPHYLLEKIEALIELGAIDRHLGRAESAEESFHQAVTLAGDLAQAHPTLSDARTQQVHGLRHLGLLYRATRRLDLAEATFKQAITFQESGALTPAGEPAQRQLLGALYNNLGLVYERDDPRAEEYAKKALALYVDLAKTDPDSLAYADAVAKTQLNLGNVYDTTLRKALAETAYREAQRIWEGLSDRHPAVTEYQFYLAGAYQNLANVIGDQGRLEECEADYRTGTRLFERLTRLHPRVTSYALMLGKSYTNLGEMMLERGQAREADTWFQQAVARLEGVLRQETRSTDATRSLANALCGRGAALGREGRFDEAQQQLERAGALDGTRSREKIRLIGAVNLARQGRHAAAVAVAKELVNHPKATALNVAHVYAVALTAVPKDLALSSAERKQLGDDYANQALTLLRKVLMEKASAPYFRASYRGDSDWDVLRALPEFDKLLRESGQGAPSNP